MQITSMPLATDHLDSTLNAQNLSLLHDLCQDDGTSTQDYAAAIPIPCVLEIMNCHQLPYGHPYRLAIIGAFLTGARLCEMDTWRLRGSSRDSESFVLNGRIYWRVGKNQHGQWRNEELGEAYIKELLYSREHYEVRGDYFFSMKLETIRTRFNKLIRPHLSRAWQMRPAVKKHKNIDYFTLELKNLRKTNATLFFAKQMEKWQDPLVALEFTAARYHHSTRYISVKHYLQSFDEVEASKWGKLTPLQIVSLASPKYRKEHNLVVPSEFKCSGQRSIRDWQPCGKSQA